MEWNNLSEDAKGVMEWVVSPITNFKQTIEIKIGDVFHRECPKFCGDYNRTCGNIDILITKELFQEILKYVTESEDILCNQYTNRLIFRLKDGAEI